MDNRGHKVGTAPHTADEGFGLADCDEYLPEAADCARYQNPQAELSSGGHEGTKTPQPFYRLPAYHQTG